MFDCSVEVAALELEMAINATGDVGRYVNCTHGITSDGAVNRLFSWYRVGDTAQRYLLSQYVARKLAQILGPNYLQTIATSLPSNPSFDGHIFELWFFAMLTHDGVVCQKGADNGDLSIHDTWKAGKVLHFDPNGTIPMDDPNQWLAPIKWNQGGYDAVHLK
ncbi:unnamed protein product [Phytophthora lilii]|uniref:Unnamed protein product n=1 Tax=Phytophthora lilii TaxID=2077276 RepID=A0A9W6X1T2_9STRA|nr:unnamed protein product [Phytophthora lilii]